MTPPMLEHEITGLQHKLLEMAGLVEQMLRQAVESVLTRDKALAQLVVDTDDKIDLLENEIESSCIQLIALHQPVATELRFLTTAMKVNHNIERIADKSVAIAKRSIELLEHPPVKPFVDLPYAAQVIQLMVKDVLDAFVNRDAEYALKIRERDSEVDEIYEKMLNELLTILSETSQTYPTGYQSPTAFPPFGADRRPRCTYRRRGLLPRQRRCYPTFLNSPNTNPYQAEPFNCRSFLSKKSRFGEEDRDLEIPPTIKIPVQFSPDKNGYPVVGRGF